MNLFDEVLQFFLASGIFFCCHRIDNAVQARQSYVHCVMFVLSLYVQWRHVHTTGFGLPAHGTASNQCATNVLTILHREVLSMNLFVRSHLQFNFGPEPKFGSVPEYGPRAEC